MANLSESVDYKSVEETLEEVRQLLEVLKDKVKVLEGIVAPPQDRTARRIQCISSAPRPARTSLKLVN